MSDYVYQAQPLKIHFFKNRFFKNSFRKHTKNSIFDFCKKNRFFKNRIFKNRLPQTPYSTAGYTRRPQNRKTRKTVKVGSFFQMLIFHIFLRKLSVVDFDLFGKCCSCWIELESCALCQENSLKSL